MPGGRTDADCERSGKHMDYSMKNDKWYRLRSGDYRLTTWFLDSQVTYHVIRQESGWVASRGVAGAGRLILDGPKKTLREAQAIAKEDSDRGL